MKSTHQFRDQVNAVTTWFKTWNECEQTVALYSLLKKISVTQAKFLLQVLLQSVQDSTDIQSIEREANNPGKLTIAFRVELLSDLARVCRIPPTHTHARTRTHRQTDRAGNGNNPMQLAMG